VRRQAAFVRGALESGASPAWPVRPAVSATLSRAVGARAPGALRADRGRRRGRAHGLARRAVAQSP